MYSVIIDKRGGFMQAPRNNITAKKAEIGQQARTHCNKVAIEIRLGESEQKAELYMYDKQIQ